MPVTRDTLGLLRELRLRIDGHLDQVTGELVRAWARAWNELTHEWNTAITQILDEAAHGDLSARQLQRLHRVASALDATRASLERLAWQAGATITLPVDQVATDTAVWNAHIIASQFPPAVQTVALVGSLDRVSPDALDAIVRRTTQQITSLLRPLSRDAYQAVLAELVRAVAVGDNPRTAARQMLRRTEGAFNGGLVRALRIARTEILDAHRAAAAAQHEANADVLVGWRWNAALSGRTCPACLAMHGTLHRVSEPGPQGHVNCRCARTPVTKSWRQLGFAVDEPEDRFPDARTWFDRLPESRRLAIMGRTRLELLEAGVISWDELAQRIRNPGWRPSYQATPLRDLRTRRAQSA